MYSDLLQTKINPSSSISEGERLTGILDFLTASTARTDQSSLNYWSRPRQNTREESTNLRQAVLRDSNLPDGDIIITHLTSINRVLTRIHRARPFVAGCRPSCERPTHPRWLMISYLHCILSNNAWMKIFIMWKLCEKKLKIWSLKLTEKTVPLKFFFLFHLDISSIVEYKNLKCP